MLARLKRLTSNVPRYRAGKFSFPFGSLQYVDALSMQRQYEEIFVRQIYDFESETPTPVILDCGGHIGLSVLRFKQLYPHSRITVFEADPKIADVLAANFAAVGLTDVKIVRAAAWITAGQMSFEIEGGDGNRLNPAGSVFVDTIRLADCISGPIDLLKLDVEGAEWHVIPDLLTAGKLRYVQRLICEFHGVAGHRESLAACVSAVTEAGFAFTFPRAYCEPALLGDVEPTPFPFARDGKFLLFLYAWRLDRPR